MRRPLVAALMSAVMASIAAFLILKRWELIGTLTGAAVFPLVYTLVSHWSGKGIDRTITVVRKRRGQQPAPSQAEEQSPSPDQLDVSEPNRRQLAILAWTRWLSVGLACAALGIGIYAIFLESSPERVIVRERVIEREVASAVQLTALSSEPNVPGPETGLATTTSTGSTTSTTDETVPNTDSSSLTTIGPTDTTNPGSTGDGNPEAEGGSVATVSTTSIGVGSQTTYPPTQTAP